MRLSRNWPRSFFAIAVVLTACAPADRDFHHEFRAFGTIVSVSIYDASSRQDQAAIGELVDLFNDVGSNWYPWAPGELQRINNAIARGESILVSEQLATLIRLAAHYEPESLGHFNAGLGRLSELWGLQPAPADLDTPPDAAVLAEFVASKPSVLGIRWDGLTLSSPTPTLMLDLGGIAKGEILALSMDILEKHAIDNAIVNIGGDLSVVGSVNGRDARIGIRSPNGGTPIAVLDVQDEETVVTSGNYERYIDINGQRYTHVFDPRTGYPVEHTASVTVVDRDPVLADAAATALMVGGVAEFDSIVDSMKLSYALLIDTSGDTRLTQGMRERLDWLDQSYARSACLLRRNGG